MNEKMVTSELAGLLAQKVQIGNEEAQAFIKNVFSLIADVLQEDKYLKIKGLGTFKLISVSSRESVAVNTGERIVIEGYNKISFTPEVVLRDLINKPFAHFDTVVLNEGVDFGDEEVSEEVVDEQEEMILVSEEEIEPSQSEVKEKESFSGKSELDEDSDSVSSIETIREKSILIKDIVLEKSEAPKRTEILFQKKKSILLPQKEESEETLGMKNTFLEKGKVQKVREDVLSLKNERSMSVNEKEKAAVSQEAFANTSLKSERSSIPKKTILIKKEEVQYSSVSEPSESEKKPESLVTSIAAPSARRNYQFPFYVCLFLLVAFLISATAIVLTTPQWFKEMLHLEGQSISIVTVNASKTEEEELTMQTEGDLEKAPSVPKTKGQESVQTGKVSAEKSDNNALWITDENANPNDFKIVGTLATITLERGNSLVRLSKQYYGSRDLWTLIVEHNKKQISDPDHIPIGSSLKIPKLEKK